VPLLERTYRRLRGQTAWIVGGRRIGQTVARALAEQGVNLIVNYRESRAAAERTAAEARRIGVRAIVVQADASNPPMLAQAVRQFRKQFPRLDILVNMPSVFEKVRFPDITPEIWRRHLSADLLGSFWPTRMALPLMPRGAHIINIADRTSIGPVYTDYLPYVVAKGAVQHLTRALAKELAPRGILVNAIAPGPILPPDSFSRGTVAALRRRSPLKLPISDKEAVEQFALLVLYLCVENLSSGATYPLDQGQNI
jgi:NAD(P)-dependent dehydrogenase (short-subunit alcohol dehydrogenase family)